jgi:uncharacterized protein (TIGR04222 family)
LLYLLVIAAVVAACMISIRSVDRTRAMETPQIPFKLDPYELAYLRGGENETTRVAIASLMERGLLEIAEFASGRKKSKTIRLVGSLNAGELEPVELRVLGWDGFPAVPSAIFGSNGLSSSVAQICDGYHEALVAQGLLIDPALKAIAARQWLIGVAIIGSLGTYKLAVALLNGHRNVGILIASAILGLIVLSLVCWIRPRISDVGKRYLTRLRLAFADLKKPAKRRNEAEADELGEKMSKPKGRPAAAYSDCLLMAAVFGVSSLAGTSMGELNSLFARASVADGGCGAGCGSGAGCGGGGCGGGCGGGGCGGCGG